MTKIKSTKRALLMSALAIIMCLSMLIGSTFAWFTDSVTSGRNTIKSGNLDVKLEYSVLDENGNWTTYAEVNESTDIFGYEYWEPGYVSIAKFKVTNAGSLALKYQLTADVYEETPGVNVAGETFYLSNYLYTEVVDAAATRDQILASTTGKRLKAPVNGAANTDLLIKALPLKSGESTEVAMAIWMPTTVGNEANHNGTVPSISFGINLLATQQTYEVDSFDDQYDKDATFPVFAWGYTHILDDANAPSHYIFDLLLANGAKIGSVEIPKTAVDGDKDNIVVKVDEAGMVNPDVTVASDELARTFDITVEGLKPGNTQELKVAIDVGTGLTGVKLYHEDDELPSDKYNYDAQKGLVTFYSAKFSPYTVVYDAIPVVEEEEELDKEIPVAQVSKTVEQTGEELQEGEYPTIAWTGWGGLNPAAGDAQNLDAVFLFKSPHTSAEVDKSFYKDWYCDYYVKFVPAAGSNMEELPEGSITLGGNYEGYGWVGFDNPAETPVNTFIPLLATFTGSENNLTYEGVCDFVQNFWCGVGKANGCQIDLNGAKFVVELRISDPNSDVEYAVNTVTYTFGTGDSVIENYQG